MVSDLIFYLFFDDLDFAFESVHSLNDAVVFFNSDRELIDFLLDQGDLSIDPPARSGHCGNIRNHGGDDRGRGGDDSYNYLFCNHAEITSVTLQSLACLAYQG